MTFSSVFQSLVEIFPQVDAHFLKAFAIEHSKDVHDAVDGVLSEIVPYMLEGTTALSPFCMNQEPWFDKGETSIACDLSISHDHLVASSTCDAVEDTNAKLAGDVVGEKPIFPSEPKQLQTRFRTLVEETDTTLTILYEMCQSLALRMPVTEELKKTVEQETLEKVETVRNKLAGQKAMVETFIQEFKIVEKETEENSKLRWHLKDCTRSIDTLKGEIAVICRDVRLLKQNFDDHVPLRKSIASIQTSFLQDQP